MGMGMGAEIGMALMTSAVPVASRFPHRCGPPQQGVFKSDTAGTPHVSDLITLLALGRLLLRGALVGRGVGGLRGWGGAGWRGGWGGVVEAGGSWG